MTDNQANSATRPTPTRQESTNPVFRDENTSVPVTPAAYTHPNPFSTDRDQSQFRRTTDSASRTRRPSSPTEAAKGASGDELLRRLSLVEERPGKPESQDADPKVTHANLHLSGNVISATFCVPYKISYASGEDWKMTPRRGTSALFDSFSYLASDQSPWNHTLVGWTGEIDQVVKHDSPAGNDTYRNAPPKPFDKLTAAVEWPVKKHEPVPDHLDLKIPLSDRQSLESQLERDHGGRVAPVWLHDDMDDAEVATFRDQQKWRKFGEHELFTLFHYKMNEPSDGRNLRKAWTDYYRMNKAFADTIMNVYKPGDVILVHDYHLLLLPSLLRQRIPNIYVGFFLHIPFPSSEYYKCMPRRKEVIEGVLGANMIGFQAYSYSRHFSSCCTRILGFESSPAGVDAYGAHVAVGVFPIGINAEATSEAAFGSSEVDAKLAALRQQYAGRKIIVGRDRLDSVRGVAQKLQAFEIFLQRHPEWHGKIVLIQVTSPTSIEERDEKSDKTASKISELVTRINGRYGSLSYRPVQHFPQYLEKDEYFALLRLADLGLITSVRDGMNTTALEYVVCQKDTYGPLIISEFSGTAGSLGDAMQINPWDLSGTADAINIALNMDMVERKAMHTPLYDYVTSNTVQAWTSSFLRRLLSNLESHDQSIATPPLDLPRLLTAYRTAGKRLFMFDYDGTLTPIVKDPQSAIPSDRVTRTLKSLAADPNNSVWIISGRDQAFLEEWMGHIASLGLSAEHGSFIRHPHSHEWENLTLTMDMSWQDQVANVFQYYTERCQGAFVERKKIALTWHYRRGDPELAKHLASQCQRELEDGLMKKYDIEVMSGKMNLEVRPRFVNKGEIARRLVKAYGPHSPEFVFCLGDDFTDEDMFRSLNASALDPTHVFATTVGASSKQTLAHWHLLEPSDVINAIAMLNGGPMDAGVAGAAATVDGAGDEKQAVE